MSTTFSPSQYQATISKLDAMPGKITDATNKIISIADDAFGWIPFLGDAVKDALNKLKGWVMKLVAKIEQILQPAEVPATMFNIAHIWDGLRTQAGTVASTLNGDQEKYGNEWQGLAGGKYASGVPDQISAAQTFSSSCGTIASGCNSIASAGLGFYLSCLAAVESVLIALIAAIATAVTVAGPIISLCAGIASCLISIGSAYYQLTHNLSNATQSLDAVITPQSTYPGGSWPLATAQ